MTLYRCNCCGNYFYSEDGKYKNAKERYDVTDELEGRPFCKKCKSGRRLALLFGWLTIIAFFVFVIA